ncbi:Exopolyphosphatase [Coemansia aciculifera]|uniref:Exopolyphosphatase n=1 Tax=Coemansia aciculifera TaxID=417176 RepID=A0ACC1MAF6_9FUNG|nr:Exopolyphosphatase [Coemansia aciculifera]
MSFISFLRALAANSRVVRNPAADKFRRLTLVLGNESADLDSISSSLALAYTLTQTTPSDTTTIIPVINIPRADLALRPDCSALLHHTLAAAASTLSDLTFIDDIDLESIAKERLDVWLVDHNAPCSRQAWLEPFVRGIVDHHVDEAKCLDAEVREIEAVGSCATLVAQRVLSQEEEEEVVEPVLAMLLLAPILVDTSGLDPKAQRATAADIECVQRLSTLVNWEEESGLLGGISGVRELYKHLDSLKGAVEHLSAEDLLRKDYKQWQVADGGGRVWSVGISSVGFPLKKWIKRDGRDAIERAVGQWRERQGLDMALVMTHGKSKVEGVKTYGRQLLVALGKEDDGAGREIVERLAECEILGLQPFDEDNRHGRRGGIYWFTQCRVESSRKQVYPALKYVIASSNNAFIK